MTRKKKTVTRDIIRAKNQTHDLQNTNYEC